jgi:Ca-activated chloride channel family protein
MMDVLKSFSFGFPWALLLLPLAPWLAWMLGGRGTPSGVRYSSASLLHGVGVTTRFGPGAILWIIRVAALVLLILGLARPRLERSQDPNTRYGIDVALVCDVSGSMDTKDFQMGTQQISRMEALINAIDQFVRERPKDRTALIGFAGDLYLLAPLTTDATWIPEVLRSIKTQGGTAIGDGIMLGAEVLEKSDAKSRVMIVVSDGFSNKGIDPVEAAKLARKKGMRVHTLQVMSFKEMANSQAGKKALAQVAYESGGQAFSASDTQSLAKIYRKIDELEKQKIETKQYRLYRELFMWPVTLALALVAFELLAASTFWLRLP